VTVRTAVVLLVGLLAGGLALADPTSVLHGVAQCPAIGVSLPFGGGTPIAGGTTASGVGVVNVHHCAETFLPCRGVFTGVSFEVTTLSAGTQADAGIFDTAGTLLAHVGAIDTDSTGIKSNTFAGAPITVEAGQRIIVCFGVSSLTPQFRLNTPAASVGALAFRAGVPQFNDTCTAAATPYVCCSGANAGTCTGFTATLGARTTQALPMPHVTLF